MILEGCQGKPRTPEILEKVCPQCGKSLFKKKDGFVECLNEGCGYTKKSARKGKNTDE